MDTTEHAYSLTNDEAAAYIGVPPRTLRRWAAAGDVPSLKPPHGVRRFSRAELDDFIAANKATAS